MIQSHAPNRRLLLLGAASILVLWPARAATSKLSIKVYKSPTCGCCSEWVDRLRDAGFDVQVDETSNLDAIKRSYQIPEDLTACHTGVINNLVIEGHVSPNDIKKYTNSKRASLGIAVPGMPANSAGMEAPGMEIEAYTVWEFFKDGKRKAFAVHG